MLLLDEPLGALDLKLRQEMQIELKRIQQEVGITFIYVTHDQEEALTMSDRIAVFSHGRIDQIGSPVEVYEHPATAFVAGFVGVSNVIERGGERFTVRPEKIRMLVEGQQPATGDETERGVVREVVYIGSVTRYIVDLDAGGTLTVVRQNVESPGESRVAVGRPVSLAWRREHMYVIEQERKGGRGMRKVRRRHVAHAAIAAVVGALAFAASGCGGGGHKSALGDWQVSGLGSSLDEIQQKAKDEGQVNLVEWAGYSDKSWADQFTKETGCKVEEGRRDVGRDDRRHLDRPVRRRLGVRQRERPAHEAG